MSKRRAPANPVPPPKIAAIILAAGASSRMGSPKALLDFHGETFVERLVRVFSTVCRPVIVALGYHAERIRPKVEGKAVIALNPAPERGQLSSLQTALGVFTTGEIPETTEGFLFVPVDCPAVGESTLRRVIDAFARRDAETLLVIPQYRGRHGHPVCAARTLAFEFLSLSPEAQAREVIHRHVPQTLYVDVDDPGILTDVDDPEAYKRLIAEAR